MVLKRWFSRFVAYSVKDRLDVFIFFAGNGCYSNVISEFKAKGIICIADEGSAHVVEHRDILKEEYRILGVIDGKNHSDSMLNETLTEYEQANYIVVPSSFVKRTMLENGIHPDKIFVNPYGVDLSSFQQIEKKDSKFRVIFCGNLSIQKGSHYLLKAVYELNFDDFEFWHIGTVSEEMLELVEQYDSPQIIYKGQHQQADLNKLYSQGSVFCIPSIQDGFAMVILQAMACGLPIICSENTGGTDLITEDGKEGFVIPIRNTEIIKEKITFLYKNQEICAQMGANAKERVSSGFTWDDYGARYAEFLQKVSSSKV
jgi:glycosyltransferase involved in cell wall biosynthesis